jgi:hypothetical protein
MKCGEADTARQLLKLLVAHSIGQFGGQPRRPLLDVVLMVRRGEAQFRVQGVKTDTTHVTVEVGPVEGDAAMQRRNLLRIEPPPSQPAATPTHRLGLLQLRRIPLPDDCLQARAQHREPARHEPPAENSIASREVDREPDDNQLSVNI